MQQIEPTGQARLEWYLAQLIAAVQNQWRTKNLIDWRTLLIGYEMPAQPMEQALAILERKLKHGNDHKS